MAKEALSQSIPTANKEPLANMGAPMGQFGTGVFGQAVFGTILGHRVTKEPLTVVISTT